MPRMQHTSLDEGPLEPVAMASHIRIQERGCLAALRWQRSRQKGIAIQGANA